MTFWIDMRLATDGGESIKRQRLTGNMSRKVFDEFCDTMTACLSECAPAFRCEVDSAQVGVTQETADK